MLIFHHIDWCIGTQCQPSYQQRHWILSTAKHSILNFYGFGKLYTEFDLLQFCKNNPHWMCFLQFWEAIYGLWYLAINCKNHKNHEWFLQFWEAINGFWYFSNYFRAVTSFLKILIKDIQILINLIIEMKYPTR